MKQALKMHRSTAVAAAVFMILSQVLDIAASLSSYITYTSPFSLISLLGDVLITVMLSIILFRGKKDTAAGVVFLLAILFPVLEVPYQLLSLLLGAGSTAYVLLCLGAALILAAFRGLSAGECLSKGKVSAGGVRMLLWLLPLLCFGVELLAQISLQHDYQMGIGESVAGSLIYVIPKWLGPFLMGIALSKPVVRENA